MSDKTEVASPPVTESAGDKLDSIISGAIDKVEALPDLEAQTGIDERLRDERGRFVSATPNSATEAAPTIGGPVASDAKPVDNQALDPALPQPIEAPARWSEAEKAEFAKLPIDAQKLVSDRYKAMEADYTRKTQEVAETRKAVEPLVQQVTQWSPYLRQLGIAPDQAFAQMLNTEYALRTGTPEQKAQALAYLAQTYGVSLSSQQPAGSGEEPNNDPAIHQLHQEILGLKQSLHQRDVESQIRERQKAEAEFAALGQAKDENGQPKFPHFERTRQVMVQLVVSGQADTWEAAYSKAVRLDDELYRETVETERKRALEAAEKARSEAVEKAKKAQPVKQSAAMPHGATKAKGLDALLEEGLARAGI